MQNSLPAPIAGQHGWFCRAEPAALCMPHNAPPGTGAGLARPQSAPSSPFCDTHLRSRSQAWLLEGVRRKHHGPRGAQPRGCFRLTLPSACKLSSPTPNLLPFKFWPFYQGCAGSPGCLSPWLCPLEHTGFALGCCLCSLFIFLLLSPVPTCSQPALPAQQLTVAIKSCRGRCFPFEGT